MKRVLLSLAMLFVVLSATQANPVDMSLAQAAASKFFEVQLNAELRDGTPELVFAERDGAFYVFNTGTKGFVIIAGDDAYRPVIGYSDESSFDANNIPPALVYYLDGIAESILKLRSRSNAVAAPMVAAEWESVLNHGRLISRFGGRGVDYLCQTQWDQSYPYNCCCPEDPNGSGGHTYVGCLATAMAQLMRFWAMPAQGIGSHCYVHEDYGQICADFGATTYDWEHMPNSLNNNSTQEEKLAVGTLGFHCGVTIDMGYGPDGSGGASGPIPGAMHQYFDYSNANIQLRRNDFEREVWKRMVREQFDMGWPMYYGGCDDGCHAFVCDGYDDFDMFHFNLGWGGSSDGWYIIDEAPYTHPADAMFNFVPSEIYDQSPSAPTNLTVDVPVESELHSIIRWTNPTTTLDNTPLTNIEQVIVMRNNRVIQVLTEAAPGEMMEIEDTEMPYFDVYEYAVYVVAGGRAGKHAYALDVNVGPTCQWKVVMTTNNYLGWNGGYVSIVNNVGTEVAQCTLNSSSPVAADVFLPLGNLSFSWTAPENPTGTMGLVIKDANGQPVYSYNGSMEDLEEGVLLSINNGCGNDQLCDIPQGLTAVTEGDHVMLTWEPVENEGYGYIVYRDELMVRMIPAGSATSFLDEQATPGGHCYQVAVLCEGGQSETTSNMSCASAGPYFPPRNLDYELDDHFRIKLTWDFPVQTDNVSAFALYRHKGDGNYKLVTLIAANKNYYVDKTASQQGDYYYRLYSFFLPKEYYSAPANRKYHSDVYELHAYYSPTGLEDTEAEVKVYPNPSQGTVKVEASLLTRVTVYNTIGQCVLDQALTGNSFEWNDVTEGLYLIRVQTENGVFYTKIVAL